MTADPHIGMKADEAFADQCLLLVQQRYPVEAVFSRFVGFFPVLIDII